MVKKEHDYILPEIPFRKGYAYVNNVLKRRKSQEFKSENINPESAIEKILRKSGEHEK